MVEVHETQVLEEKQMKGLSGVPKTHVPLAARGSLYALEITAFPRIK